MATQTARKPSLKSVKVNKDAPLVKFSVQAWRQDLINAASAQGSSAKQLLNLALSARGQVENDTAREAFADAYVLAYLQLNTELTDEQARSLPGIRNRVSEAMAVFKAVVLPVPMPHNLQQAASACRKLNKKVKPEAVDAEMSDDDLLEALGVDEDGKPLDPQEADKLAALYAVIEQLQRSLVGQDEALDLLTSMLDLAEALNEALNEA